MTAGPILPDLTPAGLERSGDLAERMDDAPIEDVIRVFVAAAHAIWHRAPKRATHDELVRELLEGIDELHTAGLP